MSVLIDEKREEIAEACQRYGIERLFIFGSALRDDFRHGDSDIDLLVEFGPIDISRKFHAYLEARAAFSKILQAEVDLVYAFRGQDAPPQDCMPDSSSLSGQEAMLCAADSGIRQQRRHHTTTVMGYPGLL